MMAAGLVLAGCGGDDDDDDSANSAAIQSCKSACAGYEAGGCQVGTLAECETDCDDIGAAPADCQSATGAYYDCELAQPDICDIAVMTACNTELATMSSSCM
jgi:hypothetical protein